jgi:methionyl-tRNA formyltransferase
MELKEIMAKTGVKLLIDNLDSWINKKIEAIEQDHNQATFTKKVEKNDGLLDLEFGKPYENYLKTKAYYPWPGTFFFVNKDDKKIRVIIKESEYTDGKFSILKVLPEGKKEMSYEDFLRGLK